MRAGFVTKITQSAFPDKGKLPHVIWGWSIFFCCRVVVVVFVVYSPLHRHHAERMHLGVPDGGTGVAPHVNPFPQFFSSFSLSLFFSSEKKNLFRCYQRLLRSFNLTETGNRRFMAREV